MEFLSDIENYNCIGNSHCKIRIKPNECSSFKSHLELNRWSNFRANLRGNGTTPDLDLKHQIRIFTQKAALISDFKSGLHKKFTPSGTICSCLSGSIDDVWIDSHGRVN